MRVVFVVPSLDPAMGGPSKSAPALAQAVARAGADVTLITLHHGEAPPEKLGNVRVAATAAWRGTHEFPTLRFRRRLRDELRGADVAHLQALWNPAITVAARASERARVPYILTPRGMLLPTAIAQSAGRKRLYRALFDERTFRRAAAFHFLTATEAEGSAHALPQGARTIVLPNGVDSRARETTPPGRLRARHPELAGRRIALYVGRIHQAKRLDMQVDALALLAKEHPDLAWVVVGPDAGDGPRLRERIARQGLGERVVFDGLRSPQECMEAFADADVVWQTSLHEGHSMAINEALAMRAPLVATTSVGFPALVEHGAAEVVEERAEAVADATRRILEDEGHRKAMVDAAARLVDRELSWDRIGREMMDHYGRLAR